MHLLLMAAEHETFWSLMCDAAHWEFEIFLIILIDGLILGLAWPFIRKHLKHHNCPPPEEDMQHTCCHCGQ